MQDRNKTIYRLLLVAAGVLLVILVMQPLEVWFFSSRIPTLFPIGAVALEERNLLLFIQVLMLFVIVPVYIFTFIFSWWYRAGNKKARYDPHLVDNKLAEVVWWGLPAVMLAVVAYITWIKTYELDPYRPLVSDNKPLKIEAIALDWKWLFIYPEEEIATVSYLRVPKGRPLQFFITADAPMNSLWIPGLGGQIYAMPGMQTQLNLIADEEGKIRGGSANISGEGFARMTFITDATSEKEFDAWVNRLQQSDRALNLEQYNQLAKPTIGHPAEEYRLTDPHLFHSVLMKYMKPAPKN